MQREMAPDVRPRRTSYQTIFDAMLRLADGPPQQRGDEVGGDGFAFGLGARKLHFVVGARPWAQSAAAGGCWPAWSILARICWGADFWPWHMLMNRSEHMIRHILGFKFAYGFAYVSANLGRIPMRATLDPSRSATNWWVYMADGCMTPKEGEDTEQFAEDPEQKYDRKEWKEDDEDGGADGVWQMVFWFVSPLTNLYIYK